MPINYSADEFSNAAQATSDNGFVFIGTPMYINCPDIGLVGEMNPLKQTKGFEANIVLMDGAESFFVLGSALDLILVANATIMFMAEPSGETIGETMTNMLGGYEYELMAMDIPDGTTEVVVMHNGTTIRTIQVMTGSDSDGGSHTDNSGNNGVGKWTLMVTLVALVATFLSMMVMQKKLSKIIESDLDFFTHFHFLVYR